MSDSQTRLVRKTIGMLVSMINSGEQIDATATAMINLAHEAIEGIEQRLETKEN
jgi:hypothetical protein